MKISAVRAVARKIISEHHPHYQDPNLWPKPRVVQELVPEVATALWENHEFRKNLDDLRARKRISPSSYNTKKKIRDWLQTCNGQTARPVLVEIYYGIRTVSKATKRAMENEREGRGGFRGLDPAYAAELKARIVASKKRGRMRIE
jgi:hypothetical protein